ncbi:MAG: hypothetical protein ACI865_000359 [Flavobacteriaceae bacterium]|jgi:hypothetical protein
MLIGADFPKIEYHPFGLDLVEPNAMIGDLLIALVSWYFAYKVSKMPSSPFFTYWKYFFLLFGVSFIFGGLGHLCFNYWGVPGKYTAWLLGIIAPYFVEQAMLSLYDNQKWKKRLIRISQVKLVLAFAGTVAVFMIVDLDDDPGKGLRTSTINTAIGLIFALAYLGARYAKQITPGFKYFWMSVLVVVPTAFFQSMKINISQYFDRNDASHVFLILGLVLYYVGTKKYSKWLSERS